MDAVNTITLETAYQQCEKIARTHYENFPVASLLLPRKLRRPIVVIYTFARIADDIVDEGNHTPNERLKQLQGFWLGLQNIKSEDHLEQSSSRNIPANNPLFMALQDVFDKHPKLPIELLFDLLRAFQQDIVKKTYENFNEILEYCHYSANPIGRILLHLTEQATEENLKDSDAICTALQLINFLQDLKSDLTSRHRCYLPKDDMHRLQIERERLMDCQESEAIQILVNRQLNRALELLDSGKLLGTRLKGTFGFEIRLITACGYQMIKSLQSRKSVYDRPTIRFWQWPALFWNALFTHF